MNKKISLGLAVAMSLLMVILTICVTVLWSMQIFNAKSNNLSEREAMYAKLQEVDHLVRQNYYGDIDEDTLNDHIIAGYVAGIGDKYGMYFTAEQYAEQMQSYDGKMATIGIGTVIDASGYIKIIEVYPDSAAETSGLKVGDLIVKVEDLDVTAETAEQAVKALQGDAGTKVNVTIRRESEDISVEVTRRRIEVPTVNHRMIGEVGYLKIKEFNDSTTNQFKRALDDLKGNGAKSLVFDVRNNPGGTVKSVAQILDMLVPEGDIVSATYKDGTTEVLYTSDAKEENLPMVVLINQKSASAAELFAQALKDYEKASIVGVNSYGKGLMQRIYKLQDGSALDITVGKYNPPKSPNYDQIGVKPDFEVKLSAEQEKNFLELNETNDPQLIKALEVAGGDVKNTVPVEEEPSSSQEGEEGGSSSSEGESSSPEGEESSSSQDSSSSSQDSSSSSQESSSSSEDSSSSEESSSSNP